MNKNKAFLLALPAIGAAFLAVLSQLSFSIGTIPITLQTFAVGLISCPELLAYRYLPEEAVDFRLSLVQAQAIFGPIYSLRWLLPV